MGTVPRDPGGDNARPGDSGGDRRDRALSKLKTKYPKTARRIMRAMVEHLLRKGSGTTDAVRLTVPMDGANPKVTGCIRALAFAGVIKDTGKTEPSRRPEAHGRRLVVWAIRDVPTARWWLSAHPDLGGAA
jgi:hypothetical protein